MLFLDYDENDGFFISAWRRKVTGDLTGVFDFAHPVYGAPACLPSTAKVIGMGTCGPLPNPVPRNNALPAQEPGTRPARALPYQPNSNLDRFEFGAAGKILAWFSMTNRGPEARRAAHFSIHPHQHRSTAAWQYTADPGATATDYFNIGIGSGSGSGKYDISMMGPNRFLRRVIGDASEAGGVGGAIRAIGAIEVAARFAAEPVSGKTAVWFGLTNTSGVPVTFTVRSNAYRSDGPWTHTVPAGSPREDWFDAVAYADGWYDFTVLADIDGTWSRRYTGHIETGAPSVTG